MIVPRLLSFTRPKEALSRISEEAENAGDGVSTDNGHRKSTHSYATAAGFTMWDDTNPLTFSVAPPKRAKTTITNDVDDIESQFQFGLPQGALEMASMDKLLHIPQDSERRTRISGKLKKLQDLVPNMDKQTSYADMLDLAVQHIRSLQNQVQVSEQTSFMPL
ncbi:Transcription factor [Sesamum angolense]|uniref:Transcription factor n=1 Tax=Sesamum angolense TaxID=2727404 RepID=A0AAE2C027_9LAMI|nr:Transcription factor [Sesamum angolense]